MHTLKLSPLQSLLPFLLIFRPVELLNGLHFGFVLNLVVLW